jgi:hypothetical protein
MWSDEIVEQTRQARDAYAAQFNYDLDAICNDLKKREAQSKRKIVSLPPKEPIVAPQAKAS